MKKVFSNIIRTMLVLVSIIFFVWFIGPMFGGIINLGNITGVALCVWVFCMSLSPLHKRIKRLFLRTSFTHFIYGFINFCFAVFLVYGIAVTGAMAFCAYSAPAKNATAVVLGAQVKPSGPSTMLRSRINAAYDYLEKNADACAVLSGGQGSDEPMSEAQAMFDALTEMGISADRLYMEANATNTTENLDYSMQIINEKGLNSDIAIVTDGFHQLRSKIIAEQLEIKENVGAVNADTFILYIPTFAVREWYAIPYQVLFR